MDNSVIVVILLVALALGSMFIMSRGRNEPKIVVVEKPVEKEKPKRVEKPKRKLEAVEEPEPVEEKPVNKKTAALNSELIQKLNQMEAEMNRVKMMEEQRKRAEAAKERAMIEKRKVMEEQRKREHAMMEQRKREEAAKERAMMEQRKVMKQLEFDRKSLKADLIDRSRQPMKRIGRKFGGGIPLKSVSGGIFGRTIQRKAGPKPGSREGFERCMKKSAGKLPPNIARKICSGKAKRL